MSGTIRGKQNVKAYWEKALKRVPDLKFEVIEVLVSVKSIVIYYKAVFGKLAAEIFFFDESGKVKKVIAHYAKIEKCLTPNIVLQCYQYSRNTS